MPIEAIQANSYNLDMKNPHTMDMTHQNVGEMLGDYRRLEEDVA